MVESNDKTFSEYVLAFKEKGASEIDHVYYFTGDSNGLENLSQEELIKKTQDSVLLWSKQSLIIPYVQIIDNISPTT